LRPRNLIIRSLGCQQPTLYKELSMTPEQTQKFKQELLELRKSLGPQATKGDCDAYWNCLSNCSTLGCSDGCCRSFPSCCGAAIKPKVDAIFAKYLGAKS
jgi:hypothetical protein